MFLHRDGLEGQILWWDLLVNETTALRVALPVLVTIAVGTSVAEDRERNFLVLVAARGVSRTTYLSGKLLGGALASGPVFALWAASLGIVAWSVGWPVSEATGDVVPPFQPGFPVSAAGIIVTYALAIGAGAMFFASMCVLLALLTKNLFVVMSVPMLIHLTVQILLQLRVPWINPAANLELDTPGLTPIITVLFWSIATGALVTLSFIVMKRKEAIG
jgi:ABC-type transport system involved in multi-copper enzyme maturation permease subunit